MKPWLHFMWPHKQFKDSYLNMRLYLASRVSTLYLCTKNGTMAPLHVAILTVQRELPKNPPPYTPWSLKPYYLPEGSNGDGSSCLSPSQGKALTALPHPALEGTPASGAADVDVLLDKYLETISEKLAAPASFSFCCFKLAVTFFEACKRLICRGLVVGEISWSSLRWWVYKFAH